jgi:hypothetical protein
MRTVVPFITLRLRYDLDRRIDNVMIRYAGGGGSTVCVTHGNYILDRQVDRAWGSGHFGVTADIQPPRTIARPW